jgi:hypothetical protein
LPEVALYSALYGRYDWVKPLPQKLGVAAYLFTDQRNLIAPGWEVVYVPHGIATLRGKPEITSPMLAHKFWKCHPHLAVPDASVTLWIDASMEVMVDDYVGRCLQALELDEWACVRHPSRGCIYPEAEYSATLTWRYDGESILGQAAFYRSIGYGPGLGLIATGANVRRHTDTVIDVSEQWWQECINWSHQDQLSLPVLFWLHPELKWNYNVPWFEWWRLHEHGYGSM